MANKGKFVIIEGPGGAGKTSQLNRAEKFLKENGVEVLITREPGGLPEGEKIRELIFKLKEAGVANPDHQMALFYASRYLWLDNVVKPAIEKGVTVLSDRYDTSTNAYQGWAEGGNKKTIRSFSEIVSNGFKPDAVILLRVSRQTGMKRKGSNDGGDPFDREGGDYYQRLVDGYDNMSKEGWGGVRWFVVDGEKPIRDVAEKVFEILEEIVLN